ncbi:hypothetical protein TI39_contig66g00011 [Zymoseptoria brevis]|uniref:Uncharacterized protein n=1 Tax=Zymoseptoria brevis TaxID=1047168 RepID=A0A0F4GXY6_9PEZI|nr:hypothetical protein TI39_contig66g00011 [Zymoseptoria brevis]
MDYTHLTNSSGTKSKSGQPKFNCNSCDQIPGGFTVGDLTCHMVRIHNVGYKAKEVKLCLSGCGKIFEAKKKNDTCSPCSDHASRERQRSWLQAPADDEEHIAEWYGMFRRAADWKKLQETREEKALRVKAARKARDQANRQGKRSRSRSDDAGPSSSRRRLHSPVPAIDHADGHSAMRTNGLGGFEIHTGSDGLAGRPLRGNLANGDVAMPTMSSGGAESMDLDFRPDFTAPPAPTIYQGVGSNASWMSFGGADGRMEYHDSDYLHFDADIDSHGMPPAHGSNAESMSTLLEPLRQELAVGHAAAVVDAPVASAGVGGIESWGEDPLPFDFDDMFNYDAYQAGAYSLGEHPGRGLEMAGAVWDTAPVSHEVLEPLTEREMAAIRAECDRIFGPMDPAVEVAVLPLTERPATETMNGGGDGVEELFWW